MKYQIHEIPTEDDGDSIVSYDAEGRVIQTRIEENGGTIGGRYHFRALAWEGDEDPSIHEMSAPAADVVTGRIDLFALCEEAREKAIDQHLVELAHVEFLKRLPARGSLRK